MSEKYLQKIFSFSLILLAILISIASAQETPKNIEDSYQWGYLKIGGGGFVSSIVAGQKEMYMRTDVGGAYKYDYTTNEWVQLFGFLKEENRAFLAIKGIAIDPLDDDIAYFLCGRADHSPKTAIFKTTDGGKTFIEIDVSNLITSHGNGDGRECTEPIAVDPDHPNIIYAGGDTAVGSSALIKSTDGGLTWNPVKGYDDLGFYKYEVDWPFLGKTRTLLKDDNTYWHHNGVAVIKIINGKVIVGSSIAGEPNIHVADVDKDEFTVLSNDLPTENFPLSIRDDRHGNLFFTYIAEITFQGRAGGAFKYNLETGEVTDISPIDRAIGSVSADAKDPNKLLARTTGIWEDQWYSEVYDASTVASGDNFFRSMDGGKTWTNITPGKKSGDVFISRPIDKNGYDWIVGKSIHWGTAIVIDPRNPDKIYMTSGNGIFCCDNIWQENNVQFYFEPKGQEEIVALDMISVKGGYPFSAVGDIDGFIHKNVYDIPPQYKPNMGTTGVIAACPQDPRLMVRFNLHEEKGYYSEDGGNLWYILPNPGGHGGRGAITVFGDEKFRIFHTDTQGINYSDNYGRTWKRSEGLIGNEEFGVLVDESDPMMVYSCSATKETDETPSTLIFAVSTDGGKTFKNRILGNNMGFSNRLAYLGRGKVVLAAGHDGAYITTNFGETVEKLEGVTFCKTVGYGAPENKGGVNTLFMYGKLGIDSAEGIYRSSDQGKTWVLINENQISGGTGDGNFLVGDMNTFGMVYMSTCGLGIKYGRIK